MEIHILHTPNAIVVQLAGRIDSSTAPAMLNNIQDEDQPDAHLILDMTRLDFMSSAGIRSLILLKKQKSKHKRQVFLAGLPQGIMDSLERIGIANLFPIYPSLERALDSLEKKA